MNNTFMMFTTGGTNLSVPSVEQQVESNQKKTIAVDTSNSKAERDNDLSFLGVR